MAAITAEEFLERYMERSEADIPTEAIIAYLVRRNVVPCHCGDDLCEGWAMVPLGWTDWRGI